MLLLTATAAAQRQDGQLFQFHHSVFLLPHTVTVMIAAFTQSCLDTQQQGHATGARAVVRNNGCEQGGLSGSVRCPAFLRWANLVQPWRRDAGGHQIHDRAAKVRVSFAADSRMTVFLPGSYAAVASRSLHKRGCSGWAGWPAASLPVAQEYWATLARVCTVHTLSLLSDDLDNAEGPKALVDQNHTIPINLDSLWLEVIFSEYITCTGIGLRGKPNNPVQTFAARPETTNRELASLPPCRRCVCQPTHHPLVAIASGLCDKKSTWIDGTLPRIACTRGRV